MHQHFPSPSLELRLDRRCSQVANVSLRMRVNIYLLGQYYLRRKYRSSPEVKNGKI